MPTYARVNDHLDRVMCEVMRFKPRCTVGDRAFRFGIRAHENRFRIAWLLSDNQWRPLHEMWMSDSQTRHHLSDIGAKLIRVGNKCEVAVQSATELLGE